MSVPPRALLSIMVAALFAAALPTATAGGGDTCVTVDYDQFAHGLSFVVSPATDSLTLGVKSGVPGDGLLLLVTITPSLCPGGFGVGLGGSGVGDPRPALDTLDELLPLIPLP